VLRAERDGTVKKIHAAAVRTLAVDALIWSRRMLDTTDRHCERREASISRP